jgi:peptidoglycan/LPS O-acetylase OafA/YrhL
MAHPIALQNQRSHFIDNLKGIACLLILFHHLAFYGPMSDVAINIIPKTIDFFYDYGRMAVSIFLVIGGFLTGHKLNQLDLFKKQSITDLIIQKYFRLVVPYLAAILLAIPCSWIASHWMNHDSISQQPHLTQLASHLFFLQNILGYESLSAGLWYVAIDFQLFAFTTLLIFLIRRSCPSDWSASKVKALAMVIITLTTISSLFIFNLNEQLDVFFIYFFAAYGLGLLSAWIIQEKNAILYVFILIDIVALALYIDYRERILFAALTAVILCMAYIYGWKDWTIWKNPFSKLGEMSYSIFLIHFPISLLVSALWINLYPHEAWMNVWGMTLSACISLSLAIPFYHLIEKRKFI